MAIPKNKQRLTVTIHNETKALLNELVSLHADSNNSKIIELALYYYASMINEKMSAQTDEGDKQNAKN